jgi:hypothetical protein
MYIFNLKNKVTANKQNVAFKNYSFVFSYQCFGSVFQLHESGSVYRLFLLPQIRILRQNERTYIIFFIGAQVLVCKNALRLLLDHHEIRSHQPNESRSKRIRIRNTGRLSKAWYLACTMREDWEESEEGGGTTGRATAVTIELLELYNRRGDKVHESHLVIKVVTLSSVYRSVVEP